MLSSRYGRGSQIDFLALVVQPFYGSADAVRVGNEVALKFQTVRLTQVDGIQVFYIYAVKRLRVRDTGVQFDVIPAPYLSPAKM
jgi:hypothetical protein